MSILCHLPSWCYYGRNTSWAYDSHKVAAAACLSRYKMASPSNTTTSTLVSSCSSGASSRHRTMSDLVPSLSFLWLTVMVDMVDYRERKIHWGSHHDTEMQHTISRTGCCLTFQRWHRSTGVGPLALVCCIVKVYCSASRLQEYSSYSRIAFLIYIIELLTSKGLDSIHIVDDIFLYNVPCVENEMVATGLRNGLPYSPIADFSDITYSRNISCTPGRLHNARSTHISNYIMTRAIIILHTSIMLVIMVYRLPVLKTHDSFSCLWIVPSGILLTCGDSSETESLHHGGELISIVHSGNGQKWKTSVQASSMTECNVKLSALIYRINTSMASCHCRTVDHNFKFPVELCTSLPGSWARWFCIEVRWLHMFFVCIFQW